MAGIAFAVLVIGVTVGQMVSVTKPDYVVAVVTKDALTPNATIMLTSTLQKLGTDVNGDGEVNVQVENLVLGQYVGGRENAMSQTYATKLATYFMSGDVMFYVFDKECYDARLGAIEGGDNFFAHLPEGTPGADEELGYWNWKGSVYQTSVWGKEMPDTLYFGVRAVGGTATSKKSREMYENDWQLFSDFVAAAYAE